MIFFRVDGAQTETEPPEGYTSIQAAPLGKYYKLTTRAAPQRKIWCVVEQRSHLYIENVISRYSTNAVNMTFVSEAAEKPGKKKNVGAVITISNESYSKMKPLRLWDTFRSDRDV